MHPKNFPLLFFALAIVLTAYFSVNSVAYQRHVTMQGEITFQMTLLDENINHYRLDSRNRPVSFKMAMEMLAGGHSDVVEALTNVIRTSEQDAVFWECAPITPRNFDTADFEFVLVPSSSLSKIKTVDPSPFAEHFSDLCSTGPTGSDLAITFANLGNNARLVAPCPPVGGIESGPGSQMMHLSSFLRSAPSETILRTWQLVGQTVLNEMQLLADEGPEASRSPRWLSTSGMGVSWLHVRLDKYPKYYNYLPFKVPPKEKM